MATGAHNTAVSAARPLRLCLLWLSCLSTTRQVWSDKRAKLFLVVYYLRASSRTQVVVLAAIAGPFFFLYLVSYGNDPRVLSAFLIWFR